MAVPGLHISDHKVGEALHVARGLEHDLWGHRGALHLRGRAGRHHYGWCVNGWCVVQGTAAGAGTCQATYWRRLHFIHSHPNRSLYTTTTQPHTQTPHNHTLTPPHTSSMFSSRMKWLRQVCVTFCFMAQPGGP